MFLFDRPKLEMIAPEDALPGRDGPIATATSHIVSGRPLKSPVPEGMEVCQFGMGCFWGAERLFWQIPGVWLTMVGYSGGYTPNPTYEEVCSGRTGHTEVVRVIFDPAQIRFSALLSAFWEGHNPTQGMRQGNDRGTQYRSALFVQSPDQRAEALASRDAYDRVLRSAGLNSITTEIRQAPEFYFAEGYHQQYLAKNPGGYCGLGGTGIPCPAPGASPVAR